MKQMRGFRLVLAAMAFGSVMVTGVFSATAAPSSSCYTRVQAEAEQLLRLHSELMVATVTCRYGSGSEDLASAYTAFTRNHINEIKAAEGTMVDFYRNADGGDAVTKLDRLRTMLANEFGQKIASLSAPVFCSSYRDRVVELRDAGSDMLDGEVKRLSVSYPTYSPVCGEAVKTARTVR